MGIIFFVLYVYLPKKERGISVNFEENRKLSDSDSSSSAFSPISKVDIAKSLGNATEQFSSAFQNSPAESQNEKIPDPLNKVDDLQVDPEIQAKYLRERKLTLLPKVENSKNAENTSNKDNINKDSNIQKNNKTGMFGNKGGDSLPEKKYKLTYKFEPGTELTWNVVHEVHKKLIYAGLTREVQTKSQIKRRWNVQKAPNQDQKLLCEHIIDEMILQQKEEGKDPIAYDSRKGEKAPREFAVFGTDKTVGKPLEKFIIDQQGMMTEKTKLVREYHGMEKDSRLLVPFPDTPVAVGDSWTIPMLLFLKGRDGTIRNYQATEKFTLENVHEGLATIRFRTILLSVVTDPVIEAQLAERLFSGYARFDMERGIVLQTELEFNKSVANAMGDASHLDYRCRVEEKLLRK
ncbi:MAG: hypothetical protein Q4G69_08035 [Planctomycetia bacterium]|nr:hypothetical protein [Planctomycetia bacterium]